MAIRTPFLHHSLLHPGSKHTEFLFLPRRIYCLYLPVHEGKNRTEKQNQKKLPVRLKILLPPVSISPRWNLLHFYNTTHQITETAYNIIHHAMVVSLDVTKEHVWADCQFVIFSSWKIWLWGKLQGNHPVPSLRIEHRRHIYHQEPPITSAGVAGDRRVCPSLLLPKQKALFVPTYE